MHVSDSKHPSGLSQSEGVGSLESSLSHRQFDDILMTYYVPLEIWYVRTIIDKVNGERRPMQLKLIAVQAHRLSSPDPSQSATTTTVPDDVFYVLKVVLSRVIATGSIHTVEKTFGLLLDAMDQDYAAVIKQKLDDVYRTASAAAVGRADKSERDNRLAFIVRASFSMLPADFRSSSLFRYYSMT